MKVRKGIYEKVAFTIRKYFIETEEWNTWNNNKMHVKFWVHTGTIWLYGSDVALRKIFRRIKILDKQ